MKSTLIIVTAIMLLIFSVSYVMVTYDGSIRTVEFLSIFAMGALAGMLLTQIIQKVSGKRKTL